MAESSQATGTAESSDDIKAKRSKQSQKTLFEASRKRHYLLNQKVMNEEGWTAKNVRGNLEAPIAYKHLSKTGGTYLEQLFKDTFDDELFIVNDFASTWQFFNKSYDRRQFLLGSIREPCDWYASLWAFDKQSLYDGEVLPGFYEEMNEEKRLKYYGPKDENTVEVFQRWLKRYKGVYSVRFAQAYAGLDGQCLSSRQCKKALKKLNRTALAETPLSKMADCFIDQSNDMKAGVRHCLKLYESRGGVVPWDKLEAAFKGKGAKKERNKTKKRLTCKESFTPEAMQMVQESDGALFDKLGYTCCGGAGTAKPSAIDV